MPASLVLYDNAFSPYAFKVRAMLYEKGIEHEKHEMRYASDRKALLAVNPRGEVPALVHGKALVSDSAVICQYLEEAFPEPALFPSDPVGRARCRAFEKFADGPVDACVIALAVVKMMKPELQKSHPEVLPVCTAQLADIFGYLEVELAGRDFLCGDFSVADISLAPHLAGAAFLGSGVQTPSLVAWQERVSKRPSIQRATAEFMQAFEASRTDEDPFFGREGMHVRDHRLEWLFRVGLASWLAEEQEAGRLEYSPVP